MVKNKILIMGLMMLLSVAMVSATCGDNVCGDDETPDNCPFDCKEDVETYIKCLFVEEACTYDNMRTHTLNITMVAFGVIALVYLRMKRFI